MHYISGTRFSIIPPRIQSIRERASLARDKTLPHNMSYVLSHMQKTEKGVTYFFAGGDGKQYSVDFGSCREADAFIARHRNETIPNYDTVVRDDTY